MYSAAFEFDRNIFGTYHLQAALAQLVERPCWSDKVEGSNPSAVAIFASTRCMRYYLPCADMSSAARGHVAPRVECNATETGFARRGLNPLHAGENVFSVVDDGSVDVLCDRK